MPAEELPTIGAVDEVIAGDEEDIPESPPPDEYVGPGGPGNVGVKVRTGPPGV